MANWKEVKDLFSSTQQRLYDIERANIKGPITPEFNGMIIKKTNTEALNQIRQHFLDEYFNSFDRNVIIYYSGFLRIKKDIDDLFVGDNDMNGFMSAICSIDKTKGVDLFLHTPGGSISAAEAIVNYLRSIFGDNIRVIIPQIAMSAGTMIACCGKEIVMGKQSSLGPTDPQLRGLPAHGVIEEFDQAMDEVLKDHDKILLWREIISKYHPTFLGDCKKAIKLSSDLVVNWLETGMFAHEKDSHKISKKIVTKYFNNHSQSKTHDRHFNYTTCKSFGLKIVDMESDPKWQDLILSIHHSTMLTIIVLNALKVIQSQKNDPWISTIS